MSDPDKFQITLQSNSSGAVRRQVRDFLAEHIRNIHPAAVPPADLDWVWKPLIHTVHHGRELVAASLTNRPEPLSTRFLNGLEPRSAANDPRTWWVMQLDLVAVAEPHRDLGLGSALLSRIEADAAAAGTRVLAGNVTIDADVEPLRRFYDRHGYRLTPTLPPFFGREHAGPNPQIAFWFSKRIDK